MEEIKAFKWFIGKWILIIWIVVISCSIICSLSSCSVSRHIVKSESKSDSSVSASTTIKGESTQNTGSKSEDKYESKTITTYIYDTVTKQYVINNVVNERKGTLIVQDTQVTHVGVTVFDTTHMEVIASASASDEKKDTSWPLWSYLWIVLGLVVLFFVGKFLLNRSKKVIVP